MSADYVGEAAFRMDPETMRAIIETHNMEKVQLRMRIVHLEAALHEIAELGDVDCDAGPSLAKRALASQE